MLTKKIAALFLLFGLGVADSALAQTNLCTAQATGTTVTYNIHGNCRQVTNSTGGTICVFTADATHWGRFIASATPWSGVSVSACSSVVNGVCDPNDVACVTGTIDVTSYYCYQYTPNFCQFQNCVQWQFVFDCLGSGGGTSQTNCNFLGSESFCGCDAC